MCVWDGFWQLLLTLTRCRSISLFASISAYNKEYIIPVYSVFSFDVLGVVGVVGMRIRMCVMYMLKDRCTSFRDSVIHNKWRHFQPNHSVLFHLYFLHFFCSCNKSFIISRLFFLRLVDCFAFFSTSLCRKIYLGLVLLLMLLLLLLFPSVYISYWRQKDYLLLVAIWTLFKLFIVIFQFCFWSITSLAVPM